jgi:hypothetical protein
MTGRDLADGFTRFDIALNALALKLRYPLWHVIFPFRINSCVPLYISPSANADGSVQLIQR